MAEIFGNVSGASLIYLLWRTDFLFTHGKYIVGCKVGSGHIKQDLLSIHNSKHFHLQYFGEFLLLFHQMESVNLNWKVKTFLLIFAPCTQLTFLGAFIYFRMNRNEDKEVG